jgi:hypothetical protein
VNNRRQGVLKRTYGRRSATARRFDVIFREHHVIFVLIVVIIDGAIIIGATARVAITRDINIILIATVVCTFITWRRYVFGGMRMQP